MSEIKYVDDTIIIVFDLVVFTFYLFIVYGITAFIIYFLLDKSHKKYPLKLRFIWFLMWFGITGNRISTEAHKIYNEYIEKEIEK